MTFLKSTQGKQKFFCHLSESGFQTILNTNFIDFINILKMPLKNMLKMFLFTSFYGMSKRVFSPLVSLLYIYT